VAALRPVNSRREISNFPSFLSEGAPPKIRFLTGRRVVRKSGNGHHQPQIQ
jgi:hypothetical protein